MLLVLCLPSPMTDSVCKYHSHHHYPPLSPEHITPDSLSFLSFLSNFFLLFLFFPFPSFSLFSRLLP